MAQVFAAYHSTPGQYFCSPMQRTMATAKPLCERLGIELELREGLKEINARQMGRAISRNG